MTEIPRRYMLVADGFVHPGGEMALANPSWVKAFSRRLTAEIGMDEIETHVHDVPEEIDSGPGVSVVTVITTSHIAIHTWPEFHYFMLDVASCKDFDVVEAVEFIRDELDVREWKTLMSWPDALDLLRF